MRELDARTQEQLTAARDSCAICREDLTTAKVRVANVSLLVDLTRAKVRVANVLLMCC